MKKEDAWKILLVVNQIDREERITNGKGATNSALIAFATGVGIPIMKLDEMLKPFIDAGIIHKKLIGKRYYYKLGEAEKI